MAGDLHPLPPLKIIPFHHLCRGTHCEGIGRDITVDHGEGTDDAMPSDRHIWKDTGIISNPRIGPDADTTDLNVLNHDRAIDIPRLSRIVDDHHAGGDQHILFDHDTLKGTDKAAFRNQYIVSDEKDRLFGTSILRVEVDARIPLDPHMIPHVDKSRSVDDDPWLDINILPVGSEKETVFEIDDGIPQPFLLHPKRLPSEIFSPLSPLPEGNHPLIKSFDLFHLAIQPKLLMGLLAGGLSHGRSEFRIAKVSKRRIGQ